MWKEIVDLFNAYMGTGLIIIFYMFALIYLFINEKNKEKRIVLLYSPLICLCLFFFPLFRKLLFIFLDNEVYYRIIWLVPISVTVAYALVLLFADIKKRLYQIFFLAGVFILIGVTGEYIYSNVNFSKAENVYHIPDDVVEICDAIKYEGREVMAVFPSGMLQYVRQYSPYICMPYGREILVASWEYVYALDLFRCMESESIDSEELSELARKYSCVYIVLPQGKEIIGTMSENSFSEYVVFDDYVVYKDDNVDLSF